jgi:hypothetical protein
MIETNIKAGAITLGNGFPSRTNGRLRKNLLKKGQERAIRVPSALRLPYILSEDIAGEF